MLYPCWISRGARKQDFISDIILFAELGPAKSKRQHLACLRLYTPREAACLFAGYHEVLVDNTSYQTSFFSQGWVGPCEKSMATPRLFVPMHTERSCLPRCWISRGAGTQDFISDFTLSQGWGPAKSQRQHLACLWLLPDIKASYVVRLCRSARRERAVVRRLL